MVFSTVSESSISKEVHSKEKRLVEQDVWSVEIILRLLCLLTLAYLAHKTKVSTLALYLRAQLGLHISVRNQSSNRAATQIHQSFLFVCVQTELRPTQFYGEALSCCHAVDAGYTCAVFSAPCKWP